MVPLAHRCNRPKRARGCAQDAQVAKNQAPKRYSRTAAGHIHLVAVSAESAAQRCRRRDGAACLFSVRHPDWPKPEEFNQPKCARLAHISTDFRWHENSIGPTHRGQLAGRSNSSRNVTEAPSDGNRRPAAVPADVELSRTWTPCVHSRTELDDAPSLPPQASCANTGMRRESGSDE